MDNQTEVHTIVSHFFRHESGKMISVITGFLGTQNLILAEDIVQDTLVEALNNWMYKGIPKNPNAWLYRVAKNKMLNAIKHERYGKNYILEKINSASTKQTNSLETQVFFSENRIQDDQLRMMFLCCHPSISKDSQIALILKTLCGFSIQEIAKAFLTNRENINKRLVRSRKKLRNEKILFEIPNKQILQDRLDTILEAIYLLFNEGYSASSGEFIIRYDLCKEAIRLIEIIVNHPDISDTHNSYALLALMQLNASRFKAREDDLGNILSMGYQNRSFWDYTMMEKGFANLEYSTQTEYISNYHILAAISSYYCMARDFESTDWKSILTLYDKLLLIDSSPIIRLNRAVVISKIESPENALEELKIIENIDIIKSNHLFYSTKAEFYAQIHNNTAAIKSLKIAKQLTSVAKEKKLLEHRILILLRKK